MLPMVLLTMWHHLAWPRYFGSYQREKSPYTDNQGNTINTISHLIHNNAEYGRTIQYHKNCMREERTTTHLTLCCSWSTLTPSRESSLIISSFASFSGHLTSKPGNGNSTSCTVYFDNVSLVITSTSDFELWLLVAASLYTRSPGIGVRPCVCSRQETILFHI